MTFSFSKKHAHHNGKRIFCVRGMGLIEAVVGITIATVLLTVCLGAVNHFFLVGKKTADRVAATYLAQEGIEAMRFIRDSNWSALSSVPSDATRYLSIDASNIGITTTPEVVDGFERSIMVRDVYRANSGDDIVASGGAGAKTLDPNTKLLEVSVYAPKSDVRVTLAAYLTNLWQE